MTYRDNELALDMWAAGTVADEIADVCGFMEAKHVRRMVERARKIGPPELQPQYPLIINGVAIGTYTADFAYMEDGKRIVEDVKGGPIREADSLRMRVFMALHPFHELRIVDRKGGSKPMKQRKVTRRVA